MFNLASFYKSLISRETSKVWNFTISKFCSSAGLLALQAFIVSRVSFSSYPAHSRFLRSHFSTGKFYSALEAFRLSFDRDLITKLFLTIDLDKRKLFLTSLTLGLMFNV